MPFECCEFCLGCEIQGADGLVVDCGVMFGHIIAEVCGSCAPVGSELFLILSAPQPMKSHVHCFQFFQDVVVDNAKCRGVVNLDGGWGLWMACPLYTSDAADE